MRRALPALVVLALTVCAFDLGSVCARTAFAARGEAPRDWALILVSGEHPLAAEYDVELRQVQGYSFDARAADDLSALLDAAAEAGHPLVIVSAHRSFQTGAWNYEQKVHALMDEGLGEAAAREEARRWIALPGCSEHHTGLAADIVSQEYYDDNGRALEQSFAACEGYRWLVENCAEYGFILRYPPGKEAVTGIHFEPWHFRYVGAGPAREMMRGGRTLEEYLQGDRGTE